MDIFSLPIDEFEQELDKMLKNISPEELLQELIKCGLEVKKDEKG